MMTFSCWSVVKQPVCDECVFITDNSYDVQAKDLRIDLINDANMKYISFIDNGPGMTADQLFKMMR